MPLPIWQLCSWTPGVQEELYGVRTISEFRRRRLRLSSHPSPRDNGEVTVFPRIFLFHILRHLLFAEKKNTFFFFSGGRKAASLPHSSLLTPPLQKKCWSFLATVFLIPKKKSLLVPTFVKKNAVFMVITCGSISYFFPPPDS